MFGDEERRSEKPKEVNEKDLGKNEDTKCYEIVDDNISHDVRKNDKMKNERMKQVEIDENDQVPFQMNCGDDAVSELEENEESIDLTSLDVERIKLFNQKYSNVKITSRISSEKNKEFHPSSNALTEQLLENSGNNLNSKTAEAFENNTEKFKPNATCKKKLDNCSVNECKYATSSTEVLSHEQHKIDTNSSLDNSLQDKTIPAPTSTQPIPQSTFSISNSNPTFIGSLVTHNGSVYYQPNTGLNIPYISPAINYHCYVMVPNRSDPNSTVSIPDFPVNPNPIQAPLLTNCVQMTTATSASMISLESLQRVYSCMTASSACNPNSILSIPVNRPTNILGAPTNTNGISLESLQHALSSIMVPSSVNPNSNLTIPVYQTSGVLPTCSSTIISSKATESINSSSNTITSSSKDSNKLQGLTSSQSSTCIHGNVETILVEEEQSSIISMQETRLSTPTATYESQVSRSSGLSQVSMCTIDVATILVAEDQPSITNILDYKPSTPADTSENQLSRSLGLSRIFAAKESTLEADQESSINIPQKCSVSTPADENRVCKSPGSISHFDTTTESASEPAQKSSGNILQDYTLSAQVDTSEEVPTKVEEKGRHREKDGNLPQEKIINQESQQNKNHSSASNSLSRRKHPPYKNSTFIRFSPRYSETKGCCSPLVRVSKNVSPLQPIRGNIQHYVITHGHDRRLVAEEGQEEDTEKGKIRRPIYLKGTPPQGYKRRLLTTAAKPYTNKVERKKRSSASASYTSVATLENEIQVQKAPNNITVEVPGSSGLVRSLEDKTPKEAEAPSDLDTKKLGTLSPSDPKTTLGSQTPREFSTSTKEDTRNPKTPSRSVILGTCIGSQRKEESGTPNNPGTQETPNKTGSPKASIPINQKKTPINTQTPNKTPNNNDCKTPKNQNTPNEFRYPNVKVFKTPKTEDKEKKRNREHRNCLKLRDGFHSLCRLLPGTRRSWSRVKLLNLAIEYITDMKEVLQDFDANESTEQLSLDDKENDCTSFTCDQESAPVSPDHVVPRSSDSYALEQYEFTMEQRPEGQDSIPNIYVVENPGDMHLVENPGDMHLVENPGDMHLVENPGDVHLVENPGDMHLVENPGDMHLEENSIYILYPPSNTNEVDYTGSEVATLNPRYEIVSRSVDEHSVDCQCVYCSTVGDGENIYSVMEQDIAVRNIEGYRLNENYVQIVPGVNGQCALEVREASEAEGRRAPEVREASESEGRNVPEALDISEEQSQSKISGTKKQPEFQIEVLGEGSAFGHNDEGTNTGTSCLEWNSSPRGYFPMNNFSNRIGSPSEPHSQGSSRVLYTTSPSLTGILSSPVILVPEDHAHSTSASRDDTHDQELPCTPQYGAYRYSNITKDLSPFVVPQSPEGLSLVIGSPGQLHIEDFSQSSNSQESQSTAYGVVSEDALNYIGATVSPFATPRLGFLPSFTELSPSQVIPEQTSVQEEYHEHNGPNVVVTEVTDFTEVGLISVAASVEIPAGSTGEKTQRKPRKKRTKTASSTQREDQTESTKRPQKRYKKNKSPVQKKSNRVTSGQEGTDFLTLSPIQTGSSVNDYNTFKTPSPRIRGKRVKRTPDGETSEVIDNESDCVPLCPLPKKRGRKTKKSQNAECKRQLINEEPLAGINDSSRVASDVHAKRGRKRKIDSLATGTGSERKKKQM